MCPAQDNNHPVQQTCRQKLGILVIKNGLLFVEPRAGKHYACVISPVQSCLIVSSLDFESMLPVQEEQSFLGLTLLGMTAETLCVAA